MRLILALLLLATAAQAAPVDFVREIQPILSENCFQCHGFDDKSRDGKRRLDTREGATQAVDGVCAIVPGKPDESELLARVVASDGDEVMPPPKTKKTLTPQQVELLRRWIAEGADYQPHWSFAAPEKPAPPAAGASHPIDAFVRARLAREHLTPASPASPDVLCRRMHLDLTGLPPSITDLDAFVADVKTRGMPAASAALADRLLASPAFGEKWARHWLDVARYADSNGYEKDLPRQQWAWRDWVIQALNRDQPYDRFLIEQLAGDLLPGATQDQRIATGFLRNGMINEEGAIIPEEFRMEAMFDRMDTLGKTAFGLTLQCAQCHSHKFDPISQEDYYGIFAFFNDTYEAQSWVYAPEQQQAIARIQAGIGAAEDRLRREHPEWPQRLAAWEGTLSTTAATWQVLQPREMDSVSGLNHPTALADHSILTLGHRTTGPGADIFVTAELNTPGATGLRLEALPHDDLPHRGPGFSFKGSWAISELTVQAQCPGTSTWQPVKLTNATADFAEPAHKLEADWNAEFDKDKKRTCGPVAFLIDGNPDTAWRADRGEGRRNAASVAVVQFEKPLDLPPGTLLKMSFRYSHSGDDQGDHTVMLGRMRLALTAAPAPKALPIDYAAQLALQVPAGQRTPEQQAAVFAAWRMSEPGFKPYTDEIEALWKGYPVARTSVLRIAQRRPDDARPTHFLDRGRWNKPKQLVQPRIPPAFPPLQSCGPPSRLDLAKWLTSRQFPLTARVAVNRVWQAIFGLGLVETADDFGTRAPQPEHRELLDWLACDLMDHGWSQKQLIRTIVTSATYQQDSRPSRELLERDPKNQLLARGPRFRAEAEVIRDLALASSGLLSRSATGGPSFFPPVPESLFADSYRKVDFWNVAPAPERYRRSLYIFRRRSLPDPALATLDSPNGDFSCARRVRSNTPLAALATLNEPVFVEAARALALRTLREAPPNDVGRATYAFRLCTSRTPSPDDIADLLALLASRKARLADGWISARELATGNGTLPPLPPNTTPADAAAWTIVARVLLNLDETLTKS